MILKSTDYNQRVDLDNYIRNEIGDDIAQNRKDGHTIEGTEDDLKRLSLDTSNRVYGCKVIIS